MHSSADADVEPAARNGLIAECFRQAGQVGGGRM